MTVEELRLRREHRGLPLVHGLKSLLPEPAEVVEILVGVLLIDLGLECFEWLLEVGRLVGVGEPAVVLVDAEPVGLVLLQPDGGCGDSVRQRSDRREQL